MSGPAVTTRFSGVLERIDARTILRMPASASAELPSRGQVAVVATFNGLSVETVVEPDGRKGHWIAIDDTLLAGLGMAAADTISVELTPSRDWPEPTIPEDLRAALEE